VAIVYAASDHITYNALLARPSLSACRFGSRLMEHFQLYTSIWLGAVASYCIVSKNLNSSQSGNFAFCMASGFRSTLPSFVTLHGGQLAWVRYVFTAPDNHRQNEWSHAVKSPRGARNLGHLGVDLSGGPMESANHSAPLRSLWLIHAVHIPNSDLPPEPACHHAIPSNR
jgi:hypothetical protein